MHSHHPRGHEGTSSTVSRPTGAPHAHCCRRCRRARCLPTTPDCTGLPLTPDDDLHIVRLLVEDPHASQRLAYKHSRSASRLHVPAKRSRATASNFLHMMYAVTVRAPTSRTRSIVKAINLLLILHADHEQNCSTSDRAPRRLAATQTSTRHVSAGISRPLGSAARRRQPEAVIEHAAARIRGHGRRLVADASWRG